ncbi:uncharacterized protein LOC124694952 [Lolium rigidum]|uniref:uncharacterized protein LOC124694952 n=1 Tax=Lolium rigidum TaxID=89674 RepID=UPI001F5CB749|nr:uncharacterized protein LOC124694952 [Lolium rigidum]
MQEQKNLDQMLVEEEEHDGATKSAAAAATAPAADGGEAAADVEAVAGGSPVTYVEHASAATSQRRLRVLPWVRAPLPPRPLGFAGLVVGSAALALLRLPRRLHLPRPRLQPRLRARFRRICADYADQPDYEAGLQDFLERLINNEKVYEPVEEGSYIKMIDMVKGEGGQLQVNSGYLPGRIVFFLVCSHLAPQPILLTRHGESLHNVRGRVGGDTVLRFGPALSREQF